MFTSWASERRPQNAAGPAGPEVENPEVVYWIPFPSVATIVAV